MNKINEIIELKSEKEITLYKDKLSLKKSQKKSLVENDSNKIIIFKTILFIIILIFILVHIYINTINEIIINKKISSLINSNKDNINKELLIIKNEVNCNKLDPINMFNLRIMNGPKTICQNSQSKHICFQNNQGYYNDILEIKHGTICIMKNIILDPSKAKKSNYIYKGPVDREQKGCPLLSKGFFNMKCKNPKNLKIVNGIYNNYFDSWNYNYTIKNGEIIEELAPNKTVLFLSRNQDSPNLFHGNSEIINILSMMHLFNLKPENIQLIFLESITIKDDPFYDIYKNLISRGGEPLYINKLKNKYHISTAIHVPINWDSTCFISSKTPNGSFSVPNCNKPTKAYQLYNNLIDKYFNLLNFEDSFISDNQIFYYPKTIISNHKLKITFIKTVTIQWRKIWPKGRKGQFRILGNGPKLADKLASILPKNILIRLVDTASLHMREQISILRKTDYLIGIHGAGLSLGIFMPTKSIFNEIVPRQNLKLLQIMSALSGHNTYSDLIIAKVRTIKCSEYIFFDIDDFTLKILNRMKESNFI
jgi:hypothetical protein